MKSWLAILLFLATPALAGMQVRRGAMYVSGAPFCGDSIKNGSDACDGSDFGTDTCATYGCSGGTLTCTGACVITLGSCTGCTGTPNLLNETFTGVGYAVAGWTETNATGVIDEDQSASCPAGTGGVAGECLDTNVAGSGNKAYTEWNQGSTRATVTYLSVYFYLSSLGSWSDTQEQDILSVDSQTASAPSAFTATALVTLVYDIDGITGGQTSCGAACWRLSTRIGGTESATIPQVTTGAWHLLHIKMTSGAATGEVVLDGVTIGSSLDSDGGGHGAWQYIRLGQNASSLAAETIYWDAVKASDNNYAD